MAHSPEREPGIRTLQVPSTPHKFMKREPVGTKILSVKRKEGSLLTHNAIVGERAGTKRSLRFYREQGGRKFIFQRHPRTYGAFIYASRSLSEHLEERVAFVHWLLIYLLCCKPIHHLCCPCLFACRIFQ